MFSGLLKKYWMDVVCFVCLGLKISDTKKKKNA